MNFSEILETEDLDLKIGHWECGIENLGMKILNWKFGVWKKLENFEFKFLSLIHSKRNFIIFFFYIFLFWVDWVNSVWLRWLSSWLSLSLGAKILVPHFFVSPFFPLCFIFINFSSSTNTIHLLLPLWFFFFISPFLLTKNTFLSFLTFPYPSPSIFL